MLDNALREPDARWETEGIGFRLATDDRRTQKKRRGPSSDAVDNGGRVLHHLCWANDLSAMSGTMDRLTRNVKDMTNCIELLGMQWTEEPHYCCDTQSIRLKTLWDHQQGSTMGVTRGGRYGGGGLVAGFSWLFRG